MENMGLVSKVPPFSSHIIQTLIMQREPYEKQIKKK
jgi:hypothetical protein